MVAPPLSTDRPVAALGLHTLGTQLTIYGSGFASSVLIARSLGTAGRGAYALPVAVATMAVAVASLGLELAQLRLWSPEPGQKALLVVSARWLAAGVGTVTALATLLVYLAGRSGPFAEIPPVNLVVLLVLLPIWVHSVLVRGMLGMAGRITTVNRALVAGDLARTTGVVALWATGGLTVGTLLVLFGLTVVVPWAVTVRAVSTLCGMAPRPRPPAGPLIRRQLKLAAVLAPHFLCLSLCLRLDMVLVGALAGIDDVGRYSIAVLVSELVWLPTWSLANSVRERQAGRNRATTVEVTAHAVRMTVLMGSLMAVALAVVAPFAIGLVFGPGFRPAVGAVWALLPASVAMAVWRPLNVALIRLTAPWKASAVGVTALAVNVVANLVLVPWMGIVGAGLASVAAYGCGAALAAILFRREAATTSTPVRLVPGRAEWADLLHALRPTVVAGHVAWLRAERQAGRASEPDTGTPVTTA